MLENSPNLNNINKSSKFLVFTDGSALGNSENAFAGCATLFPSIGKMYSKGIIGTNNFAELSAIRYALRFLYRNYSTLSNKISKGILIYSDSMYSINVVSGKYKANKNEDIINECKDYIEKFQNLNINVDFRYVKAHTGKKDYISKCNDIVDKKAREQATKMKNK
mgnify:CR=1 FL=1